MANERQPCLVASNAYAGDRRCGRSPVGGADVLGGDTSRFHQSQHSNGREGMKVFISWSGDRSKRVAEALRDWLPNVIQSVDPFMSSADIGVGSRWADEIGTSLEESQFGLLCLTPDNLKAPWLLFEAGALSKSIANSRVMPYLYEVTPTEIEGPLAQFQAANADKSSTLRVIKLINEASEGNVLDSTRVETIFEVWWPKLEEELANIPDATEEAPPSRTEKDILEEILGLCRQMSRQGARNLRTSRPAFGGGAFHDLYADAISTNEGLAAENPRSINFRQLIDNIQRLEDQSNREQSTSETDEEA